MSSQLLLHLPTEIAQRFRDAIPPRQRLARKDTAITVDIDQI